MKIFVFGSNKAGRHWLGSALHARRCYGALYGVGEGRTGNAYAIPTKDEKLSVLPLEDIKNSVDRFLEYANNNSELEFEVAKIGCGLAEYQDYQVAPMFIAAPTNCHLHEDWIKLISLYKRMDRRMI